MKVVLHYHYILKKYKFLESFGILPLRKYLSLLLLLLLSLPLYIYMK
jgi:hypothetical protein